MEVSAKQPMHRFKSWLARHEISVSTTTALISAIGWIGFSIGGTLLDASQIAGLPTWAATAMGMGSLAFMWVGRWGADIARKLSGWQGGFLPPDGDERPL